MNGVVLMPSALKAALDRCRALLLAAVAGGAAQLGGAYAATAPEPGSVGVMEESSWREAQQEHTPEAYQRYLELFPTGEHAEEAFRLLIERSFRRRPVPRLVDLEPALAPGAPAVERIVVAADLSVY
jgi:hypothetical protein